MNGLNEKRDRFFNLNTILHRACYPPPMAYTYFPKGIEIIEFNPNEPLKTLRRIFEGGVKYNSFEREKLDQLSLEIKKKNDKYKKKNTLDKLIIFPETWKEFNSLRFLQARTYDFEKTIEIIKDHLIWRKENIPLRMTDKSIEILNDLGFVYFHGRDCKFRPTIVVNAKVYMQNQSNYAYENWIFAFIYLLEYGIKNLLLPGQIENWNIICDLADVSVLFLPADFKKIFATLQCNYRCRLYVMYLLNMSSFIVFLWDLIKKMLDPTTERKLKILPKGQVDEMFRFINPEMIEKKFGGTAPNVTHNFFPPIIPSQNYLKPYDDPKELFVDNKTYLEIVEKNPGYVKSPYIRKEIPKPIVIEPVVEKVVEKVKEEIKIEDTKEIEPTEEDNYNSAEPIPLHKKTSKNSQTHIHHLHKHIQNYLHNKHIITKNVHRNSNKTDRTENSKNNDFTSLTATVDVEFSQKNNLLKKKQCVEIGLHKHIGPHAHFKDLAKLSSHNRSTFDPNKETDISKIRDPNSNNNLFIMEKSDIESPFPVKSGYTGYEGEVGMMPNDVYFSNDDHDHVTDKRGVTTSFDGKADDKDNVKYSCIGGKCNIF